MFIFVLLFIITQLSAPFRLSIDFNNKKFDQVRFTSAAIVIVLQRFRHLNEEYGDGK